MCNGTNKNVSLCRHPGESTSPIEWNKQLLNTQENEVRKVPVVEEPQRQKINFSESSSSSSLESLETKTEYSYEEVPLRTTVRKRKLPVNEEKLICRLGESLSAIASRVPKQKDANAPFVGRSVPKIQLVDYLQRMVRYLNEWQSPKESELLSVGTRAMVISMIYIDRICGKHTEFALSIDNIHRICMSAMLVATKFLEDEVFPNCFWSRVAGVSLAELNNLEKTFCHRIDFDLWVTDEEFNKTFSIFSRYAVEA
uniref:Cyclin-like domain-containing protein n=2 Tax=Sar TaxID=2698737 RepID=A0A7S3PKS8_9STRA|mmetsp:Transcript_1296/g.1656  ORF Transcript_1296/g.1656 Transcript_1296/m.1656 type:complete len:255 (-) Transcript_1296:601-1365(-)